MRRRGRNRSENVGTSSDKTGEKPVRRKPEVSWARLILPGSVGPKSRARVVGEGKRVNIPHLDQCFIEGVTQKAMCGGDRVSVLARGFPAGKSAGQKLRGWLTRNE